MRNHLGLAFGALLLIAPTTATAETVLGVMTDVGVPDGATASLVYRPIPKVRMHVGVGHNLISTGVRGGVTLAPFKAWFTPTLSVDYGRYPEGDANPLARRISGDEAMSSETLENVGYDFANAHVGFQFGRKRFSFFLQAGASRVTGNLRMSAFTDPMSNVTFSEDPKVTVYTVSARLGFTLYVY